MEVWDFFSFFLVLFKPPSILCAEHKITDAIKASEIGDLGIYTSNFHMMFIYTKLK